MLRKGGNLESGELTKITKDIMQHALNENGQGEDIEVTKHMEIIKNAFMRWKNANLEKFQQLHKAEMQDVEMLLNKIHVLENKLR